MQNEQSPFAKGWREMRILILPALFLTIGFNLFASNALPWQRVPPEMEAADTSDLFGEDQPLTPIDSPEVVMIDTPEVDIDTVDTDQPIDTPKVKPIDTIKAKEAEPRKEQVVSTPSGDISGGVKSVTTAQAKRLLDENRATFIDARRSDQFEKGHIPGSLNIYAYEFGDNIPKVMNLSKDRLILIYCDGGLCELSHDLSEELITFGFKKIVIYQGGWEEWSETDYPKATGK